MEDQKRKRRQESSPNETEPSYVNYVSNVRPTPQVTDVAATPQTDYQLIFGAASINNSTTTTNVLNASRKWQFYK